MFAPSEHTVWGISDLVGEMMIVKGSSKSEKFSMVCWRKVVYSGECKGLLRSYEKACCDQRGR